MDYSQSWLLAMLDAGGDLEAPPSPEIPLEYRAKPRRAPRFHSHPASPPPTSSSSPTTKRKRAPLATIPQPNLPPRKRQRPHMPPKRQSPRKKTRTEEDDYVENGGATPKQPRRKPGRTPRIEASIPKLTPVTSQDEAEDGEEDEPASSVARSTETKTSAKRSISPTKTMVDLRVADKKVTLKSIRSRSDVPDDVQELYKKIQSSATFARGIIPRGIEDEVEAACDGVEPFDSCLVEQDDPRKGDKEQLRFELRMIKRILSGTSFCKAKHAHEPTWNERVHSQILLQAVENISGIQYHNITTARVMKDLIPNNQYGEELKKKMVDYAITLQDPLVNEDHVTRRLASSEGKLVRSINPSDHSALRHDPIVVSIETKTPDGSREKALVQLSLWVTAHFTRLGALASDPATITLPLLFVSGEHWQLMFARDSEDSIDIIDGVGLGSTDSILGCYKILASLRHICDWASTTFQPWFSDNVLRRE